MQSVSIRARSMMPQSGVRAFSTATFELPKFEGLYKLDEKDMPSEATVSKDDLRKHFDNMVIMRRMEIVSDLLYKKKEIFGFCHLYDG